MKLVATVYEYCDGRRERRVAETLMQLAREGGGLGSAVGGHACEVENQSTMEALVRGVGMTVEHWTMQ